MIKKHKLVRTISTVFGGVLLLIAVAVLPLAAQANVQTFGSDDGLQVGTIVQVNPKDSKKVITARQQELDKMYGVIISPDGLPFTITDGTVTNQVFVVTNGKYNVLVGNENGAVKTGDNVTLSGLNGVAMKASIDQDIILGKALGNFDGKDNVLSTVDLKYKSGKKAKTVSFGLVPVSIDIKHNPEVKSTKTRLPSALERFGEQIADKELSPFRIYMSISVVVISVIIAVVVLYAGIRSSVISIGRNPLSKKSIFRSLLQIILTAFIILIIGMFTVYLILKL